MTGDLLLSLESSVQVACLACVLIGSLAEVLSSFLQVECVSALQMVDVIIGKMISSMFIAIPNSFMD